ncbi:TetR/AcrR family transcriptional regulator [Anaerosporobacter sp.]
MNDKQNDITKGEVTKQRIIECAANLFITKGYNNTGVNDILKETNLPKGSFYYHFNTKKELAIEVANYFSQSFGSWLKGVAKNRTWREFVEQFMNKIIHDGRENIYFGCPFAVLGCELAFLDEDIANAYLNPLKGMVQLFAEVLQHSAIPETEIKDKSNHAFALFEGYVLYYRVSKDITVLERLKDQLIKM